MTFDAFLNWARNYFPDEDIDSRDSYEIKINSVFTDDNKHKMWCNPAKGTFHCWKSNAGGTLFKLISHVEKITETEARKKYGVNDLRLLEQRLEEFYAQKKPKEERKIKFLNLHLPLNTIPIDALSEGITKNRALEYLEKRKNPSF